MHLLQLSNGVMDARTGARIEFPIALAQVMRAFGIKGDVHIVQEHGTATINHDKPAEFKSAPPRLISPDHREFLKRLTLIAQIREKIATKRASLIRCAHPDFLAAHGPRLGTIQTFERMTRAEIEILSADLMRAEHDFVSFAIRQEEEEGGL